MDYETMDITLTAADARDRIAERVDGVRIHSSGQYYEFTSPAGFHLAELSETTLPNGDRGARLKYRTAMISPVAAVARTKAGQIRDAVAGYRVERR